MGDMADYFIEQQLSMGWSPVRLRLFEDKRGDRNEKLLHQCGEAFPDDFEDLT